MLHCCMRSFGFYKEMKFVNLTLVNNADGNSLTMNQFMSEVDKFQQNEHNKLMVITGDPGSGKTTLMRYLAREWAEGKVLQSCQILFLIYLGRCKVEYKSLSDLLKGTEYNDFRNIEQIAKMIGEEHGKGACFLLDAYDEKLVKEDIFEDMINLNHLPHSIRIVTSRPYHLLPINSKPPHTKLLDLMKNTLNTIYPNYLKTLMRQFITYGHSIGV